LAPSQEPPPLLHLLPLQPPHKPPL
jgi:hypothetical protein